MTSDQFDSATHRFAPVFPSVGLGYPTSVLTRHQAHKLPRELYKSLIRDRGKEMADHTRFSLATGIQGNTSRRALEGSAASSHQFEVRYAWSDIF